MKLGQTIGAEWYQFAGDDETRAADLQLMLDDPDINAIMAAKGGYGTIRILDQLDFNHFRQQPKWLTGFSDVTVLHAFLNHRLSITTIHGPMAGLPDQKPEHWQALTNLKNALIGKSLNLTAEDHPFNKKGSARGEVIGGNLSIIYSLLGSPESFDPTGKILFIEEVDEYLYHLDRMLWALKRAGKFNGLAGIMIGSMTEMRDNEEPFGATADEIVDYHLSGFNGPIAFGVPAGHVPHNSSFYLGQVGQLDVNKEGMELAYANV